MKRIIVIIIILAIAGAAAWLLLKKKEAGGEVTYEFTAVERGNIENVVSCTGELDATSAVDVGTQVSGTVNQVLVDYNEIVTVGQPLAIIDTTQLVLTMKSQEASMKTAEANLAVAHLDHASSVELREKDFISDYDLAVSAASLQKAEAAYISAQTSYEKTRNDLRLYSIVRSPINGSVIDKQVEAGQTVAASLNSPTLFTIAEDLTTMEILAYLDESDIGLVKEGMPARFTVDAYPDNTYEGAIKQIRLQPVTVSNVVNYIVVVSAENTDGLLLPGMTATVDFISEQVNDVLTVPASALSYRPDDGSLQLVMQRKRAEFEARSQGADSASGGQSAGPGQGMGQGMGAGQNANGAAKRGALWFINDKGELDMTPVTIGATDGTRTQVTGFKLEDGMQIIVDQTGEIEVASGMSNGLFGPPRRPRGRR